MREQFLKELTKEEMTISELKLDKSFLDSYDEMIKNERKRAIENSLVFAIAWMVISAFTDDGAKMSTTLIIITFYALINTIKYNIVRIREEKKLNKIDVEKLEMDMYNSEEKMNGLSKAMLREINEGAEEKVYCKK